MDYSWPSRGTAGDGVIAFDAHGRIDFVDAVAADLLRYQPHELLGRSPEVLLPEAHGHLPAQLRQAIGSADMPQAMGLERDVTARRGDGVEIPLHMLLCRDQESGRVIARLQMPDAVSGEMRGAGRGGGRSVWPGRNALHHDLEALLRTGGMPKGTVFLLFVEIDPFAGSRGTLGAGVHCALLRECAERLQALETETARLYRTSEDNFAFLLDLPACAPSPEPMLSRLIEVLRGPIRLDAQLLHVEFAIGHACAPDHGLDPGELIANAAMALSASKAAFNRPVGYDQSLRDRVETRHELLRELHRAIDRDEFELHYQPQVDLGSGEVVALEALLRWRHPERGLLLPAAFMEVLSASELSLQVGGWVLREACTQVAAWNRLRSQPVTVAVNVFPRQFDLEILPVAVALALAESGLAPGLLDIEITENIVVDPAARSAAVFQALEALGVSLVLDDFGTGYASLTCLARHPVHKLKIDKSFVDGLQAGPGYRAILQAMRVLAGSLGLGIVVEGVETEEAAAQMRELGFDIGQGFLWSRPLQPDACARVLGVVEQVALV